MPGGFDEDQARFAEALGLADYLASWDFRCAFTGESIRSVAERDPMSALLRLEQQSELSAGLILPACVDAREAYEAGGLAIGPSFNLILNPRAIPNVELLERLNPNYRLRLPHDMTFAPNLGTLRKHALDLIDIEV
jgi:hypothetical protein